MRELLEQFFRHYLRERNLEDTLALLTDQVISLGTGEQEVARNKEELRALMECEFKEMPQPLDYELFNYTENPLGEYGWSIFTNVLAKIDSEGVTMEMLTRLTCICVKRGLENGSRLFTYVYPNCRAGTSGIFPSPLWQE